MALTLQNAVIAGEIAADIAVLQVALAAAQAALAAGVVLKSHSALGYLPGTEMPLSCNYELSQADSATVLNALVTIYTNDIVTMTAQLAAM